MPDSPSTLLLQRVSAFPTARLYEVGGMVRDRLLNRETKDHDYIITGLPAEHLRALFMADRVDFVGESFGVYKVQLFQDGQACTEVLDIALPRTERSTGPRHRDFEVQPSHELPIKADLSRRDLTINAIARDVATGEYIDPFNGTGDLNDKLLRFVGQPIDRIREDPLRIMRLFRFLAQLEEFTLEPLTHAAAIRNAGLLSSVAPERLGNELLRALENPASAMSLHRALDWFVGWEVVDSVIPELGTARTFEQHNPHHAETVAWHCLSATIWAATFGASLRVRLALLLHDLGKLYTRTIDENGVGHFYRHDEVGAPLARTICTRLKLSGELTEDVVVLVAEHMSPALDIGPTALRRWMHRLGPLWQDALMVRRCDRHAHLGNAVDPEQWYAATISRCEALEAQTSTQVSDHLLALSGTAIMAALGLPPGQEVGRIKAELLQEVVDGVLPNEPVALLVRLRERHAPPA